MKQVYAFIVEDARKRILVGKKADIIAIAVDFPGTQVQYAANLDQLLNAVKSYGFEVICHNPTTKMEQVFLDYAPIPPAPPLQEHAAPAPIVKRFAIQPVDRNEFAVMVVTDSGTQFLNRGLMSVAKEAYLSYVKDRSLLFKVLMGVAG